MTTYHSEYMFSETGSTEARPVTTMCACGCGQEFVQLGYGRPKLYLNKTHKSRAYASRKREQTITFVVPLEKIRCDMLHDWILENGGEASHANELHALTFLCEGPEGPEQALAALKTVLGWLK